MILTVLIIIYQILEIEHNDLSRQVLKPKFQIFKLLKELDYDLNHFLCFILRLKGPGSRYTVTQHIKQTTKTQF